MTDPVFAPAQGVLRLSEQHLSALAALVSGRDIGDGAQEALERAGLWAQGKPHRAIERAVAAVAEPSCRVCLSWEIKGRRTEAVGWANRAAVVLLLSNEPSDELRDVVVSSTSLFPQTTARLVRLGPRPDLKADERVEIDELLLEALLTIDAGGLTPSQIESVLDGEMFSAPWMEALSSLSSTMRSRWMLGAWWDSPEESPTARALEVIDLEGGLLAVGRRLRQGARWRSAELLPVRAAEVWGLLTSLLPRPEELASPSR